MKKTGQDLRSNYGKIKKLLLLAKAIKTILTPHSHDPWFSDIRENYEPQHLGP